MLHNEIFIWVLVFLAVLPSIVWGIYLFKITVKILNLLNNKHNYNLNFLNAYFLHYKLFWDPSSFPKEIQDIYRPIRKIGITFFLLGFVVILSLVTYLIIISK